MKSVLVALAHKEKICIWEGAKAHKTNNEDLFGEQSLFPSAPHGKIVYSSLSPPLNKKEFSREPLGDLNITEMNV